MDEHRDELGDENRDEQRDQSGSAARDIPRKNEEPQRENAIKTAQAEKQADSSASARPGAVSSTESAELSAGEEPSGYRGENPSTAGSGSTGIHSATPENALGRLNPSAPGDTGITPGTTAE